jgi:hypothetical protein
MFMPMGLEQMLMQQMLQSMMNGQFAMDMARNQNMAKMPAPMIIMREVQHDPGPMPQPMVIEESFEEVVQPLSLEERIKQAMNARDLREFFGEVMMEDDPLQKHNLKNLIKERYQELGDQDGR